MQISAQYRKKVFGDYVKNMFRFPFLRIPFLRWENGEELIITKNNEYYDEDMLRWYLKIFDTKYPKNSDNTPLSFSEINSKTMTDHIEYYRLVLAHNGLWFDSDEEEWQREKAKHHT